MDYDLDGTAHLLYDVDKKVMVHLRDGGIFIGYLRSVDQFSTILLESTVQRIYIGKTYGDVPVGNFVIRGENIILVGEIDSNVDSNLPLRKISKEAILKAQTQEKELKREQKQFLLKSLKERGCLIDLPDYDF